MFTPDREPVKPEEMIISNRVWCQRVYWGYLKAHEGEDIYKIIGDSASLSGSPHQPGDIS